MLGKATANSDYRVTPQQQWTPLIVLLISSCLLPRLTAHIMSVNFTTTVLVIVSRRRRRLGYRIARIYLEDDSRQPGTLDARGDPYLT